MQTPIITFCTVLYHQRPLGLVWVFVIYGKAIQLIPSIQRRFTGLKLLKLRFWVQTKLTISHTYLIRGF